MNLTDQLSSPAIMARLRKLTALATIEKVIRKANKKAAKKYKRKIVALKAENRRLKASLKLLPDANDEEEVEEEEDELGWHGLTADAAATAGVDLIALNQATEVFINHNVNAALAPTIWACASPEVLQGTRGTVVLDIDPVTKKPRGYQNGKHFTEFRLEDLVEYTGKEPSYVPHLLPRLNASQILFAKLVQQSPASRATEPPLEQDQPRETNGEEVGRPGCRKISRLSSDAKGVHVQEFGRPS